VLELLIYLFFASRIIFYDLLWHVVPNRELLLFALLEVRFFHLSPLSLELFTCSFVLGLIFSKYIGGGDTKLICLLSFLAPNLDSFLAAIYLSVVFGCCEILILKMQKREKIARIAFAPWILAGGLVSCCLTFNFS
jgi:Flp pilus assembly protein protease CpaA